MLCAGIIVVSMGRVLLFERETESFIYPSPESLLSLLRASSDSPPTPDFAHLSSFAGLTHEELQDDQVCAQKNLHVESDARILPFPR